MARTRRRTRAWLFGGLAAVALLGGLTAALIATGTIWPNRVGAAAYDVRGVDVSSYQGEIDWPVLAAQDLDFAWIKATEGSGTIDSRFAANWADARETDLLVGAYHFLSFDSPAETQAANIIATVPDEGTLPITVDVECYADYCTDPADAGQVRGILTPLLDLLEAHYGVPPVLYATGDAYERYLAGGYPDNPIWIRDVVAEPTLPDGRAWTVWQYSHRERLDGYDGDEPFIDLNVFAGTLDELAALAR
ncbi:GH25 family lysozyme [Agromyces seonyuensis]|uniref:Lysozyme n=1 Tax=Agromyces seonyuensis TaxID=2662446 RepID=A0A6I4NZT3_9MICO|nr:GH25 family lysozyme [Agromyces seonyuensis]MWB99833.1 lysozyme [Agromyces seonyuensis]